MECNQVQVPNFYPDEEVEKVVLKSWDREKETSFKPNYCNRNNEVVKIFNQECVICFERECLCY